MTKKFEVNDRVEHEYLGKATVKKVFKSWGVGYVIYTDEKPDVRYNMGNHECLVFSNELTLIKK